MTVFQTHDQATMDILSLRHEPSPLSFTPRRISLITLPLLWWFHGASSWIMISRSPELYSVSVKRLCWSFYPFSFLHGQLSFANCKWNIQFVNMQQIRNRLSNFMVLLIFKTSCTWLPFSYEVLKQKIISFLFSNIIENVRLVKKYLILLLMCCELNSLNFYLQQIVIFYLRWSRWICRQSIKIHLKIKIY